MRTRSRISRQNIAEGTNASHDPIAIALAGMETSIAR